jgi:hypothetical protein
MSHHHTHVTSPHTCHSITHMSHHHTHVTSWHTCHIMTHMSHHHTNVTSSSGGLFAASWPGVRDGNTFWKVRALVYLQYRYIVFRYIVYIGIVFSFSKWYKIVYRYSSFICNIGILYIGMLYIGIAVSFSKWYNIPKWNSLYGGLENWGRRKSPRRQHICHIIIHTCHIITHLSHHHTHVRDGNEFPNALCIVTLYGLGFRV